VNDLPERYSLNSIEQLRALADALRQQIIQALMHKPMTVTQVGENLGLAPAKIHYHVRELERVGLVRLVETREKGGILEKYYQPVARDFEVPGALLHGLPPDEPISIARELLERVTREFLAVLSRGLREQEADPPLTRHLSMVESRVWITENEFQEIQEKLREALAPFHEPRGIAGEEEHSFSLMGYQSPSPGDVRALDEGVREATESDIESASRPHGRVTGAVVYTPRDLQKALDRGEPLDINALGFCKFTDDVTAGQADRAIQRFRHRGVLHASEEVRAVLRRKESAEQDPSG